MRALSYDNLQLLFTDANTPALPNDDAAKIHGFYNNNNRNYSFFDSNDSDSKETFVRYFRFFKKVSESEDSAVTDDELAKRAYTATVLFGGCASGKECGTLQRYLNENYKKANQPIHDAFAAIQIQQKSQYVDLPFWRELINGVHTKKAISLFSSASDIGNKFGLASPTSKSYELVLTKNFPKKANTQTGKLYIHPHKEKNKLGYAYLNEQGNFIIAGTIDKTSLQDITALEQKFNDQSWKSGELSDHKLATPAQENIFCAVNTAVASKPAAAAATKSATPVMTPAISRKLAISDIEVLQGKLTYSRFAEHPELAGVCRQYKMPESLFNQCLGLLPEKKKKDNLPDVTVVGTGECDGYILTKLPIDDPRAFLLGHITNCCQSIGGNSEGCVIDGWRREDNGFYVLLKRKGGRDPHTPTKTKTGINYNDYDLVGQAYAWRSCHGNLVFDSWENLRPQGDDQIAVKMLTDFSQRAVSESQHAIFRVTIGTGGRTPDEFKKGSKRVEAPEKMLQGWQYGDSRSQTEITSRANIPTLQVSRLQEINTAVEKIQGITPEQKEKLKSFAPLSVHYSPILNLAENKGSTFNHFLKIALANEKFFPDMIDSMIALHCRYDATVAEETLGMLMKSGLSTEHLLTSSEAIAMDTDSEDDEEENDEGGDEIDEHDVEAVMALPPEEISAEIPRNFVGLSLEVADFIMMLNEYSVQPSAKNSALQKLIEIHKVLTESSNSNTSFDQYEIFKLSIVAQISSEPIKSQVMSQLKSKIFGLEKHGILPTLVSASMVGDLSLIAQFMELHGKSEIIGSGERFRRALQPLSEDQRTVIYEALKDQLPKIIKSGEDFGQGLEFLSIDQRKEIYDVFKDQLPKIIKSGEDFGQVLKFLSIDQRKEIYDVFKDQLPAIIKSGEDFGQALQPLSEDQCRAVCEMLKDQLPKIIKSGWDFRRVLQFLSVDQCKAVCTALKDQLPAIIKSGEDFRHGLEFLSTDQCKAVCTTLKDQLPKIIKSGEDFRQGLEFLSTDQRKAVCTALKDQLPKIIESGEDFRQGLEFLSTDQRKEIYDVFKDQLPKIIKSGEDFGRVLKFLSTDQRKEIYDVFKDQLPKIIKSGKGFGRGLEFLSTDQRKAVYEAFKDQLPKIIESGEDFREGLEFLSTDQRKEIYDVFKDQLPKIIESGWDFRQVLEFLSTDQRKAVYEAFKDQLPKIIKSGWDFRQVLEFLSTDQCKAVCTAFKNQLPRITIRSSEECNALQALLQKYLGPITVSQSVISSQSFFGLTYVYSLRVTTPEPPDHQGPKV